MFKKYTQKLVNQTFEEKEDSNEYPPVFFVALNRGFDFLTPLLRDMNYASMYFNLMHQIDHVLEYELELEREGVIKQISNLNEKDTLWLNFKYAPFF